MIAVTAVTADKKEQASATATIETASTVGTASIILTMATKPTNDNDRVVVESGTPTGAGPVPPPPSLEGTTNNNNEEKVITTLVTTEPPNMTLTGSDVAAICKIVTHPINDEERQFIHTMKTYLAEQGGSLAILQRCSEGGGRGGGQGHRNSGPGTAERTGIDIDDDSANNINCLLLDRGRIDTSNPTGTADDGSPADKNDCVAGRHLVTTSSLFTEILNYLDPKSLIEASFVSKPWNIICHSPTMEQAIVPYVRLKLNVSSGLDGITNFVRKMKIQFEERELLKNKYQRFELHVIGDCPNTLENSYWYLDDDGSYCTPPYDEIKRKSNNIYSIIDQMPQYLRMDGIVSLVITVSRDTKHDRGLLNCYWNFFSKMFPQLRDFNVLDSECNGWAILENGFGAFFHIGRPHLTKVVFKTKDRHTLWGGMFESPCTISWSRLKEIFIDDHIFVFTYDISVDEEETMEDLQFLRDFSKDYKVLERLSIRNARYVKASPFKFQEVMSTSPNRYIRGDKIPQNHLVKFVRNAPPALKWFRSDLSQENIRMLKIEKPNIYFVN